MKVLDLTNLEKSEIKYTISKFPDGQQQVKIEKLIWTSEHVQIKAQLNNFKDLELIICAVKSLRNLEIFHAISLYVPYFLGSRSDRKFEQGSNNYLKDIICPIINSLKFHSVTVIDPHSDVLEACLNNFKKVDNISLVNFAISNICNIGNEIKMIDHVKMQNQLVLISPDAGANKKIFKVAEQIGYTGDIITCSKSRDEQGNLSRVQTNIAKHQWNKDFIIIDDICDGGRTFIELAKKIKAECPMSHTLPKIYLIVTHGIFSKGFKELSQYFDGIYCTNSYRSIGDVENGETTNVKQLNVF